MSKKTNQSPLDRFMASHRRSCTYFIFSGDRHCSCGRDDALKEIHRLQALDRPRTPKMVQQTFLTLMLLFLVACGPLPEPIPLPFLETPTPAPSPTNTRLTYATPITIKVGSAAINVHSSPDLGSVSSNVIAWGVHQDTMTFTGVCHTDEDDRLWVQILYKNQVGWVVSQHMITPQWWSSICERFE